jgi:hypothetical protein
MVLRSYQAYPRVRPRRGIGVAALMLGILAVPMLLLCGMGLVVALAGIVVGGIAFACKNGRGFAVTGITISALTLVIGGVGVTWFLAQARECANTAKYPDPDARERCVQQRFPFVNPTRTPAAP